MSGIDARLWSRRTFLDPLLKFPWDPGCWIGFSVDLTSDEDGALNRIDFAVSCSN
jgi:hypothetical protein